MIAFGEKLRSRLSTGLKRPRLRRRGRAGLPDPGSDATPSGPSGGWCPPGTHPGLITGRPNRPPRRSGPAERARSQEQRQPPVSDADAADDADQRDSDADDAEQHELFLLHVCLRHGRHLLAMDSCGTSDPYINFKLGGKVVYKSTTVHKTLNPVWNEHFHVFFQDPFQNLHLKAYDHDWGINDDFLGQARVDLSTLELNEEREIAVPLCALDGSGGRGTITLSLRLESKSHDEVEQMAELAKAADSQVRDQPWSKVVNIVLVEAQNLLAMDACNTSDPYVKFRLGSERYKSKTVSHTLSPRWLEEFSMYLYSSGPQSLMVEVFDRDVRTVDDFMGKCTLDLSTLETEQTHHLRMDLEEGAGCVLLLVTISGTTRVETASDLLTHRDDPVQRKRRQQQFGWLNTWRRPSQVGYLTVKVYKAQGLSAADINGKSDPFCVVELVNQRRQTHTAYKTLAPQWNKIFTFDVKDIYTVLEVTVYDEDHDHQVDFLGKIVIPLLKVQSGVRRWYSLKNQSLHSRAKGNDPQILLEMDFIWNGVRAGLRSFTPREEKLAKPEVKFQRSVFVRTVNRLSHLSTTAVEAGKLVRRVLEWESAPKTVGAYFVFLVSTYCFELYMVPAVVLLVFLKGKLSLLVPSALITSLDAEDNPDSDDDDDDDDDDQDAGSSCESLAIEWRYWRYLPDEKKTLKEKLLAVQEVMVLLQSVLSYFASLVERIQNTVDFTVPSLSWLAVLLLLISTITLYYVPLRYVVMLLGSYVISKRLFRSSAATSNELLSFLACVPDNDRLRQWRELPPLLETESRTTRRQRQRDRYRQRFA